MTKQKEDTVCVSAFVCAWEHCLYSVTSLCNMHFGYRILTPLSMSSSCTQKLNQEINFYHTACFRSFI